MRRLKSLEFRLPAIIGLLVLTTMGVLVIASYLAVRRTAMESASTRLVGSSTQLATLIRNAARTLLAATRAAAGSPAVIAFARDPSARPHAVFIQSLQGLPQGDRLLMAELRDSTGRRRFAWGPSIAAIDSMRVAEIEQMIARSGPATLGAFRSLGDSIVYPVGAPVTDGSRRVGYLIHWRAQNPNPQANQLAALFGAGEGSSILVGDTSGRVWMDFAKRVSGPPVSFKADTPLIEYRRRPGDEAHFVAGRHVPGTPWIAAVDVPRTTVTEPVKVFLVRISAIAFAFLAMIFLAVWWVSRSVTRPVGQLATAAKAFESGDHDHRLGLRREDELGDLARAFDQMADATKTAFEELKEADRKKDRFLATLAHELRNPLAPLLNGVATLRAVHRPSDPPTVRMWDIMERQLRVLTRLVDDLLEVSRISRGAVELRKEDVQVSSVVQQALENTRLVVEQAGHRLTTQVESNLVVRADPIRLAQVVFNLVHNAVKYTPPGGEIVVEARREAGEAVITVRDNGRGIPAEMLSRVFDVFVQLDAPAQSVSSGLGVGLTLVRELVELHGGTVTAASDGAGQGSAFIVRLPLLVAVPETAAVPVTQVRVVTAATGAIRTLVVDDNRDAADMLVAVLKNLGAESSAAYSGAEALVSVSARRPRILFLDIGMPDMDGYEVARRIRREYGSAITVIAVTGWGTEEDRRRSANAGFDHHVVKPVRAETIKELLDSVRAAVV